jgi:hypothetical protein
MIQTSDNICTKVCNSAIACGITCKHSRTNCCLECYVLNLKLKYCNQLKGTDYFKFIILYHKNKKSGGKENA